jgi:hypothetical protein
MHALAAEWPLQKRADFARRVLRAAVLHALSVPWVFARFARACERHGRDLAAVLHAATRGWPGPSFLQRRRRRPSAPLLALLAHRLEHPERSAAAARRALGEERLASLPAGAEVLGRAAPERHHWVFALGCDEPAQLVRRLRRAGFDATARSSLVAVGADEDLAPEANRRLLERLVYVPLAPAATPAERAELVHALRDAGATRVLVPTRAPAVPAQRT